MEESAKLYHLMREKMEQENYCFKLEAVAGYLQVLFYNGYQWMLDYTVSSCMR